MTKHSALANLARWDLVARQHAPAASLELDKNSFKRVDHSFSVPKWFTDQQAWILDPVTSSSRTYNLPICLRIRGTLNPEALERAIQQLQARHSALRSIFRVNDDGIEQMVLSHSECHLTHAEVTEDLLRDKLREAVRSPFDLTLQPALRATLFRHTPTDHVLLLTAHHLVCDDWSTGICLKDVFTYYRALTEVGAEVPKKLDFQYHDFINWLERLLKGQALQARLSFWRDYLAGRTEYYYLDLDRPRPQRRSGNGNVVRRTVPTELIAKLKQVSQEARVSLFMSLLAAFQCVLHRRSGNPDIAVGSCAANRTLTSIEPLVGRFANDVIVRTDFSGNPSFRELLSRVRDRALRAYTHQDMPFAGLLEKLGIIEKGRSSPSIFQVMFILQDAPKETAQVPNLSWSWFQFDTETSKYDFCVFLNFREQLEIALEYDTDVFERDTISVLLEQYISVLQELVHNPDARVGKATVSSTAAKLSCAPEAPTTGDVRMQHIEPADERIISTLQEIWKRGFRQDTVGLDDDFFQLGGDSLLAAHLFAEMNSYFNVSLPIITLAQAPTIRKLASAVREQKMRSVARSVVPIRVSGSRPPLFCAHGQSGNLLMYHSLAQHMGGDQPLYGLQPRGIDQKQEPLNTIEEMASVYIDEIKQIQSKGSYFLLGYCMGGSIVIEMAQQLVSRGEKIGMLAVVDSYNVGVIQPGLCDRIIFKTQMYWFGLCHFFAIDRGRKIAFIRRRLNELRIPPSEVHHANTRAALSYHARPYPGQLLHVSPLHQFARYSNPDVCWDKMVGGVYSVSLPIYPGQMFEEPHVASLAKAITTALQRRTPGTNICA